MKHFFTILIASCLFLISCSSPSPDEAKREVFEKQIDPNSDLKKDIQQHWTLIKDDPNNDSLYLKQGKLSMEISDETGWLYYKKQAVDNFTEAIKLNPKLRQAYYLRAKMLSDLERTQEALDDYRAYLKLEPDDLEAIREKGRLLLELEDKDSAEEETLKDYNEYLKLQPYDLDILQEKIALLKDLRDTTELRTADNRLKHFRKVMLKQYEKVNNIRFPKTVEEAVELLLAQMDDGGQEEIRNTKKEDLINYHFSLGMYIRNQFGLWAGNYDLLKSCGSEDMHPDDASMVIIKALWAKLQK